ncbi:MAG: helix-hairpin-helix domain-containing protein [Calditrichaeota bacterium]|nr:MAG: helix-hairpin-helix domain-containing protein [Calditrichota bacterium]
MERSGYLSTVGGWLRLLFVGMAIGTALIGTYPLYAQEQEEALTRLLENIESEEISQVDFVQALQDLEAHPLNINTARAGELLRIPFWDEQVVRQIVRYRRRHGPILHPDSLLRLPGISPELLAAVRPYLQFGTPTALPRITYRIQVRRHLHTVQGYDRARPEERRYHNPYYLYHRGQLQLTSGLRAGLIWEKDAGEANPFDFGSGYLTYSWRALRATVHLGDFVLESGQQLLWGSEYGLPLMVDSHLLFTRPGFRWRPKTTVEENVFWRGLLGEFSPGRGFTVLTAYSDHRLDGSLSSDSVHITLYRSGYHRTQTERAKRDRVRERAFLALAAKSWNALEVGVQVARLSYAIAEVNSSTVFPESGTYLSGYFSHTGEFWRMQGEAALGNGKYPAFQQSVLVKRHHPNLFYGVLWYYYHPRYRSFHGRGFGEISEPPNNETGYFVSVGLPLGHQARLAAYFHVARPVRETESFALIKRSYQIQLRGKFSRSTALARFTYRVRKGNRSPEQGETALVQQVQQSLRLQLNTPVSNRLRLVHRLETSWARPVEGVFRYQGIALYEEVHYRPSRKFSVRLRYSQFDIPGFDFRLYEFEPDLPGTFRNVLLHDRGWKWFVMVQYRPFPGWGLALKYQEMVFPDRESLGSGLDTIAGNRRREIRLQMQIAY